MVYVKEAIPLRYSQAQRFRMGRTTIQLQPKRSWTAALRNAISTTISSIAPFGDSEGNRRGVEPTAPSTPLASGSFAAPTSPGGRRSTSFSFGATGSAATTVTGNGKIPSPAELQNIMFSCHSFNIQSPSTDKNEVPAQSPGDYIDDINYHNMDHRHSSVNSIVALHEGSLRELTIPEVPNQESDGVPADSPVFDNLSTSNSNMQANVRSARDLNERVYSARVLEKSSSDEFISSNNCSFTNDNGSNMHHSIITGNNDETEILHLTGQIVMKNDTDVIEDDNIPKTCRTISKDYSGGVRASHASPRMEHVALEPIESVAVARLSPSSSLTHNAIIDDARVDEVDSNASPAVLLTASSAFCSPKDK